MSELEQVSKEMMDELEDFGRHTFDIGMNLFFKNCYPELEHYRCTHGVGLDFNVFLKIIKHVNGDPQFEAEKPKKWIVRSKKIDLFTGYWFLALNKHGLMNLYFGDKYTPYKFDTREEAEKWSNPQTEVVEVE
ncbi:hypothetical protein [Weissella minor]|uniref:Uncharacterized protein n=1 Tax=Weissella minor TaxID=1620 RepID=A0A0R2JNL9_9LACO|nr:hypothetical protein [Weissella minor]KRN77478.1 hypothetical protein IV67_GL001533 [Weissella minor]